MIPSVVMFCVLKVSSYIRAKHDLGLPLHLPCGHLSRGQSHSSALCWGAQVGSVRREASLTVSSSLHYEEKAGSLSSFWLSTLSHPKLNYTLIGLRFIYGCVCMQLHVYIAGIRTNSLNHELSVEKIKSSLLYLELNPDIESVMILPNNHKWTK